MIRVNFFLPSVIHSKIRLLAQKTRQTESDILRRAVIAYIEQAEQMQLEKEIKQACENYREFNKGFSPKWTQFDQPPER